MNSLLCIEGPFQNLSSAKDPVLLKNRVLEQMLKCEELLVVNPNYLENTQGGHLTQGMRRDIVMWMATVCEQFGCSVQIYPLAVNFLDRMLSYVRVRREDLQLTATACLLIASKLMQAQPFSIAKLTKLVQVSNSELLETELFVLGKLKWDLCAVTPFDFVDNLLERLDFTSKQRRAIFLTVQRLVNICCSEYRFLMYPPSLIATGAICVACRLLHLEDIRHGRGTLLDLLHLATGIEQEFIETCEEQLDGLLEGSVC